MPDKTLILASASPRRAQLLSQINVVFNVHAVDIDERVHHNETPYDYVQRLALEKARAAKQQLDADVVVLGSDTSVIVDQNILGKPINKDDAKRMLRLLSGRSHHVLTSVAVIGQQEHVLVSDSTVTFCSLNEQQIETYLQTEESYGKAGAYAIQGAAAQFIERIDGSFSGVMGLPLYETACLLKPYGLV